MRTVFPTFSQIRIGEPDANVEHFNALRSNEKPIFLTSFFTMPNFPLKEFRDGTKFLIYGQKGTGKTTIMRYLENELRSEYQTDFLVFKRSFNEESDLHAFSNLSLIVDDEKIERYKHFMHAIKRILIFILIKQAFDKDKDLGDDAPTADKGWVEKIRDSSVGDVISLGFDSIKTIFSNAGVDLEKVSASTVLVDAGRLVKRSNDDLLKFLIRRAKRIGLRSCIFIDEIHFSYRSTEALQQDAMLVRDCILAVHSLNDRFAEEKVDIRLYSAVRAEYLDHPIISSADINHSVESVGYNLTWSTFPENKEHPLFKLLYERFKSSIGNDFTFEDFIKIYFANMQAEQFLSRTWAKPRDFVRFFKCAKDAYPQKSLLNSSEQNAVRRQYAQLSWSELKSAASAFLTPSSIERMEDIFRRVIPLIIDKHKSYNFMEFQKVLRPIYQEAKGNNKNFYSENHFSDLMYIIGLFGTRRESASGTDIVQTYHRGNRSYHRDGKVLVHPAVLKAFG